MSLSLYFFLNFNNNFLWYSYVLLAYWIFISHIYLRNISPPPPLIALRYANTLSDIMDFKGLSQPPSLSLFLSFLSLSLVFYILYYVSMSSTLSTTTTTTTTTTYPVLFILYSLFPYFVFYLSGLCRCMSVCVCVLWILRQQDQC